MLEHRFREHLQSRPVVAVGGVGMGCAFVPCPAFSTFTPAQQTQVQEIYRIAAERTREQLRPSHPYPPQFSLN